MSKSKVKEVANLENDLIGLLEEISIGSSQLDNGESISHADALKEFKKLKEGWASRVSDSN